MVRPAARLQYHLGGRQSGEKSRHLPAPQLAPQPRALLLVNRVHREDVLGRIDGNALKLHGGRPSCLRLQRPNFGTPMPWGRPPQHVFAPTKTWTRGSSPREGQRSVAQCKRIEPLWLAGSPPQQRQDAVELVEARIVHG